MCAQFLLRARVKDLYAAFPSGFPCEEFPEEFDLRVLPRGRAPIFYATGDREGWGLKEFSLVPGWSKDRHPKFATHNARIESVLEKPTWKKPFLQRHCVIPLTEFIEPIYQGVWAGAMVAFGHGKVIFAAGIHDSWMNVQTGEVVESFAILTTRPSAQIQEIGHDRSPIFLSGAAAFEWVRLKDLPGAEQIRYLEDHEETLSFEVREDRRMRAGWEKRQ